MVLGPLTSAADYGVIALSSLLPVGGVWQGGCWILLLVSPPRVCLVFAKSRPCTPDLLWARYLSSLTKGLALLRPEYTVSACGASETGCTHRAILPDAHSSARPTPCSPSPACPLPCLATGFTI